MALATDATDRHVTDPTSVTADREPVADPDAAAVTGIADAVAALAGRWRSERARRQPRRALDPADFAALAATGFPLLGLAADAGGHWRGAAATTRAVAGLVRTIAAADSSVALVAAMHAGVLQHVNDHADAPGPHADAWTGLRTRLLGGVRAGAWWGTLSSEPGSHGRLSDTRTIAEPAPEGGAAGGPVRWLLTGDKHFGSGLGVLDAAVTAARVERDDHVSTFVLDLRGSPLNGRAGITVTRPWDGHGMPATQSHAVHLERVPAVRVTWPGFPPARAGAAAGLQAIGVRAVSVCSFAAVVVGILDAAEAEVGARTAGRRLDDHERQERVRAGIELFLARQAFEGMLRAAETGDTLHGATAALQGKVAVAELAESVLRRLSIVLGGSSFSRGCPLGWWERDVRALAFLRPPVGVTFDALADLSG